MSVLLTVIVASLTLALLLEARFPLRAVADAPLRRWFTNLSLSALSLATSVGATVGLYAAARALLGPHVASIELLPRIGAPAWVQWMLTFAVLDGTTYVLHRLSHSVPWLWRLHAVHHSDTEVDATTSYRHHPLESLFTAAVNVPLLLLLGAPVAAVLAYTLLANVVSVFSHANVGLPMLEHALRHILVTPAFHRVHHAADRPWTDRNFATVFPIFDRLLGTAATLPAQVQQSMTLGLEHFRSAPQQQLGGLLAQPFVAPGERSQPPRKSAPTADVST